MNAPANSASMSELRTLQAPQPVVQPDQRIDMFSLRGFELANRIAKAFAASDAVPAQFRLQVEKRGKGGSTWVENPAAIANCIVAIEMANAIGMSITAVMQQANVIEGKLSWSAQFIIAAINASGLFTPLRFQIRNLGRIKATYREKQGWNDQKKGFDFIDRTVELENLECVAWAYTRENGRTTTERIESAPVSMKMAVEEGWYAKPGSKWQTEMKHQMLQYRAGAFFGRIHAPHIVMGMGQSSEERVDMTTIDVAPDGRVVGISTEELRRPGGSAAVQVVEQVNAATDAHGTEHHHEPAAAAEPAKSAVPTFDANAFAEKLENCKDIDTLDLLAEELRTLTDADTAATLTDIYKRVRDDLQRNGASPAAGTSNAAPASRRAARAPQSSME